MSLEDYYDTIKGMLSDGKSYLYISVYLRNQGLARGSWGQH